MSDETLPPESPADDAEVAEWLDSLEWVLEHDGEERARLLVGQLEQRLRQRGVVAGPPPVVTPYVNSIAPGDQAPFPGDRELEHRLKSLVRWNAMAMVVRANRDADLGGHISTYASLATLTEVAFNHFLRAPGPEFGGDLVYFQGHAAPGMYARAFLEGRLTREQLENFRRELAPGGGLPSYPHPWLMPDFWQFPTVSMGLGPLMAIYQARFARYLAARGLTTRRAGKVVVFLGDGETDEPEAVGALTLAAREGLDNLIFCVNCNLQRLDGPVRGNGKIIQELEGVFRGAGWHVLKVIWGEDWDPLLAKDRHGLLVQRMNACPDGEYQKLSTESGAYIRRQFFGKHPELLELVAGYTDEHLRRLRRGGHDPAKVYAAFRAAWDHVGGPTVILAQTLKGYGLGAAGEGRNVTHQQKKLNIQELREFRARFGIPIADEQLPDAPFYRPPADLAEMVYLRQHRAALGGELPARRQRPAPIALPADDAFAEARQGTGDRPVSTTFAFVQLLTRLLRDPQVGKLLVPIIPDEARTFGMDPLFRQVGIYASRGQQYEPVDAEQLAYYREARDGQILEEGITEAGAMASFIAAGTAAAVHGVNTIPFFIFYSMFGLQRVGDLIWAAGDSRCRGFLLGATAGRTTLNGEGLQHQDGHSLVTAAAVPNLISYDPAFAYELALIVRDGLRRMYVEQEDVFYYLTLYNEAVWPMPPLPPEPGVEAGTLRGLYRFRPSPLAAPVAKVNLFGSGPTIRLALTAARRLEREHRVAADVWSATSYTELRRDALDCERWNRLHPEAAPRTPYVTQVLAGASGPVVAATDYVKLLPDSIRQWVPGSYTVLGTDGFGRSDTREALRHHFEIDERFITLAALTALAESGAVSRAAVAQALKQLRIAPEKPNPRTA